MKTEDVSLQPNPTCAVCSHPQRMVGAVMRDMNATVEEIATALQLDSEDVAQHFALCVPKVAGLEDLDNPAGASDAQLALLLQHSLELFHAAGLMGNMVASASALAVRLRTLTEIGRRSETRAKHESLLENADPLDANSWPSPLASFVREVHDDILHRVEMARDAAVAEGRDACVYCGRGIETEEEVVA